MNINRKIEEIRRQPEHIRLRYVWGSVAISMLIIIALWIFSLASLFHGDNKNSETGGSEGISELKQQLQEINNQAPSLTDPMQQLTVGSEGVSSNQDSNEFKYPATEDTAEVPQSDDYSELPQTQTAR